MSDQTKSLDLQARDETAPVGPTGLLIIRAWIEPGSSEPLRASIRISTDISAGVERTVRLARPAEVCDVVQEWLDDVMGHDRKRASATREVSERLP
ncbi:MAG: hypothetical protein QOG44_1132 [Acidimicrobiaceae bacterium]|jgi:hypothetical protein|nr:hypothetical protein [Acidimicrobiaceae bacterium]